MAESPSHRFGQIVGGLLEEMLLPVLTEFCAERNLFLDRHGERVGVRKGKKVSWTDRYGNSHDLDFVIEKNASPTQKGRPVAFIEAAWRSYTKHSRAKAQEIQGAVLPIAELYEHDSPFLGAVLAGLFTKGALEQLSSLGFKVIYISYESVVDAFSAVGIDARFDQSTPDADFAKCSAKIESLADDKRAEFKKHLLDANRVSFDEFFKHLKSKLDRLVQRVVILPLFGMPVKCKSIDEAYAYISGFKQSAGSGEFQNYEVAITFSNGDKATGTFTTKERAIEFLTQISRQ